MTRSFYWYQDICPCDLDHLWNWPLSGAFVFHKRILFKRVCNPQNPSSGTANVYMYLHIAIFYMQDWGILPSAVSYCKGPEFVRSLKALLQLASKNVPSPILVVGT